MSTCKQFISAADLDKMRAAVPTLVDFYRANGHVSEMQYELAGITAAVNDGRDVPNDQRAIQQTRAMMLNHEASFAGTHSIRHYRKHHCHVMS